MAAAQHQQHGVDRKHSKVESYKDSEEAPRDTVYLLIMREIISLHVGQAGIQAGTAVVKHSVKKWLNVDF